MSKYPEQPKNHAELKDFGSSHSLEFPVDPGFVSLPPRVNLQAMLRRLEETMPWRSTRPGEQQRRLAAMVDVEFVL